MDQRHRPARHQLTRATARARSRTRPGSTWPGRRRSTSRSCGRGRRAASRSRSPRRRSHPRAVRRVLLPRRRGRRVDGERRQQLAAQRRPPPLHGDTRGGRRRWRSPRSRPTCRQNTPVTVRATASDNRRVRSVEFRHRGEGGGERPDLALRGHARLQRPRRGPAADHRHRGRPRGLQGQRVRHRVPRPDAERRQRVARREDDRRVRQEAPAAAGHDRLRQVDARARQAADRLRAADRRRGDPGRHARAHRQPRLPRAARRSPPAPTAATPTGRRAGRRARSG